MFIFQQNCVLCCKVRNIYSQFGQYILYLVMEFFCLCVSFLKICVCYLIITIRSMCAGLTVTLIICFLLNVLTCGTECDINLTNVVVVLYVWCV